LQEFFTYGEAITVELKKELNDLQMVKKSEEDIWLQEKDKI